METDQQTGESINSFDDGSESYTSDNSFRESVRAAGEKIRIQGIETMDEWELVHPWSGKTTVGVITVWRPDGALFKKHEESYRETLHATADSSTGNMEVGNGGASASSVDDYDGIGPSDGSSNMILKNLKLTMKMYRGNLFSIHVPLHFCQCKNR